jgi:mannose-6-phosphate isomerase-like protein (cupin superfamily)
MYINSTRKIRNPIETETGEMIYELVGRTQPESPMESHSLARVVIPPGKSSPKHHHNITDETYYILNGEARIVIDGEERTLMVGDTVVIPQGSIHQIFNDSTMYLDFLAISGPAWSLDDKIEDNT